MRALGLHPTALKLWQKIEADRPKITTYLEQLVLDIWRELQNDRPRGMADIGPIPSKSITEYCEQLDFCNYSIEMIRTMIRVMEADQAEREQARKDKADRHPAEA